MAERAAEVQKEKQLKEGLIAQSKRATALRSRDREFHGLEREFHGYQEQMQRDYEASKDIKHPRDVGQVREVILRKFLAESGLLAARYSVSKSSVRVASTTGHSSNELDILLYDALDSTTLMRREDVYEVFPVENTYGAIQVKSRLNKKTLREGMQNIASYKKLKRQVRAAPTFFNGSRPPEKNGFGILFAYETDMEWLDIINELRLFAAANPRSHLCNLVLVLSEGYFLFGDDSQASAFNSEIEKISVMQLHGIPDRQGQSLWQLYAIISELLLLTPASRVNPSSYFRLPLTAGDHSYSYRLGQFAEMATCSTHGDYARKYTAEKIAAVIDWCKSADSINWIRATDIANGEPGDNEAAYARQPGDVKIYNPDGLPLSEILLQETEVVWEGVVKRPKALAFDVIESGGLTLYVPFYYQQKLQLTNGCPRCKVAAAKKRAD
jgi:hypothetical protein